MFLKTEQRKRKTAPQTSIATLPSFSFPASQNFPSPQHSFIWI